MRSRILIVSLAVIFTAALVTASGLVSEDLADTRDLASLEFNDPGSVDILLGSKREKDLKIKSEFAVDQDLDHLQVKHDQLKTFHQSLLEASAEDNQHEAEIDSILKAVEEGEELPEVSLLSATENAEKPRKTRKTTRTTKTTKTTGAGTKKNKNVQKRPPKAHVLPLPSPLAKLGRKAELRDYLKVTTSEINRLGSAGLPVTPYAKTLLKQVKMLHLNKERLVNDIKQNRIISALDIAKMKPKRSRRMSKRLSRPARGVSKGRPNKAVIDCTACRYAWLKVEQDLGNSRVYHQLYDVFVQHCSSMQESDIFFQACNKMFGRIDKMIADYVIGHTVNQMCMKAEMCR